MSLFLGFSFLYGIGSFFAIENCKWIQKSIGREVKQIIRIYLNERKEKRSIGMKYKKLPNCNDAYKRTPMYMTRE
jgi:hypothetical protein